MTPSTFPALLAERVATQPDHVAMQEKRYGIWQPITWREYQIRVDDFAHGLASIGIDAGQVVAIVGDNRPEWLIAELAVQSIGAAVVGVYPASLQEELVHVLDSAEVEVVVAEDQEQVDKLIGLKGDLPRLRSVIFYDPHGLEQYQEPLLTDFLDVERAGRAWREDNPGWLQSRLERVDPDDVAVICTTSGTTSKPKLAEISHRNMIEMARHLGSVDPMSQKDRYVSFLPFAWMGEQMLAVACGMTYGFTISFPEDSATQKADMREIGPSILFSPPRIWESMLSDVQVRIDEAGWLKRRVFGWGFDVGDRVAGARIRGGRVGWASRVAYFVANQVALRPLRDHLGLARIRRCYTGGAPLGPDLFGFFHAVGVNLKQIYGQTEICGIAVVHRDDDIQFDTVGVPLPGTEVDISDDGEILLRSDAVFLGYHRNPEATQKTVDSQGWLHTGDAGYLNEDGHLVVVDRLTDVLRAPDGTQFSAAFIENKLKFSPYIEEAVVFGGPRPDGQARHELTALITLDLTAVSAWAEQRHIAYTTYSDLAANQQTYDLVAGEVSRANAGLSSSIRVKRFVLLHKQFDPDDDEITRTRKVRRSVIAERYADIISALDRGEETAHVTSTVSYQDGTTRRRELAIKVREVPEQLGDVVRRPVWTGRS